MSSPQTSSTSIAQTPKSRFQLFGEELHSVLSAAQNDRPQSKWGEPRRVMAHLRRGATFLPRDTNAMLPFLAPFLSEDDDPRDQWFFVIAALAASYGDFNSGYVSLGQAASPMRSYSESCAARFAGLLACNERELPRRLREITSIMAAQKPPLAPKKPPLAPNWGEMLYDLAITGWNDPQRRVQNKWAKGFYSRPQTETSDDSTPAS